MPRSAHQAQDIEALHVGKAEVEDYEVRLVGQGLERRRTRRDVDDVIPLSPEAGAQQPPDGWFVVDDEDADGERIHAAVSRAWPGVGTGRRSVKTAPG